MKKILLGKRSLFSAVMFIFLALSVHLGFWDAWDILATRFLQGFGSRGLDIFFALYGYLGSPEITGLIGLFLCWRLWKKRDLSSVFAFCLAGVLLTLIEVVGKELVFNPGPPPEFQRWPFERYPGITLETPYTFPSGHMLRTFFLLLVGFRIFANKHDNKIAVRALIVLLTFLMMVERVYMGDHWMSDVAGALILGYMGYLWTFGDFAQRIR